MYIMVSEPIPSTTAAEIKEQFENMTTLQELADVILLLQAISFGGWKITNTITRKAQKNIKKLEK